MNKKLIFLLSLLGLEMAFATVFIIPSNIEPLCWSVIFVVSTYVILENCTEKYFLNGFCVSLLNAFWITTIHILLYDKYMANHLQEAEIIAKMPMMQDSPKLIMLITGLFIGIISGLILGLFAWIASKIIKKNKYEL